MFLTQFDWLEEKCIAPKHFTGINLRTTVWCCADHSIKKLNYNRKISIEFFLLLIIGNTAILLTQTSLGPLKFI